MRDTIARDLPRYAGRMDGGRRQMLFVLPLILGVLCMHALILIGTAPVTDGHISRPGAAATAPGAAQDMPAHASAGTTDATAAYPIAQQGTDHSVHGAGHGSMPSSMHQILHLCLAILAALLVLGMAALALWPTLRPDRRHVRIRALVRRASRRRPPPTSVRLAQLCVLRT